MHLYIVHEYLIALIKTMLKLIMSHPHAHAPSPWYLKFQCYCLLTIMFHTKYDYLQFNFIFVEEEHIDIVARFSYCITGILIYSPMHIKKLVYLIIILTNKS